MYRSPKDELSIWGESYAGHYVPGIAAFIERQNDRIAADDLQGAAMIEIDTVGILNGGIDFEVTAASYPRMAYNNTYGFQAITEAEYESAIANLTTCTALVGKCRNLSAIYDSENYGNNVSVNAACSTAYGYCALNVEYVFQNSGVGFLVACSRSY